MTTITSADDASRVPEDGFQPGENFILDVLGGTTINAVLQKLAADGETWVDVPDPDDLQIIDGNYSRPITAAHGDKFAVYVTDATGTWWLSWKPARG